MVKWIGTRGARLAAPRLEGISARAHVATPAHVALWDAINEYACSTGGDPSKGVYGNTSRQNAVAAVERAVDALLTAKAVR